MFLDKKNVTHRILVNKTKIYLPPFHIKIGLIKKSVKAKNKQGEGFDYLRQKFQAHTRGPVKEGIFVGLQVKQLFKKPTSKVN